MKSNKIWRVILPVFFIIGLLLITRPEFAYGQEGKQKPDVEPALQAQILSDSTVGYIIYLRKTADLTPAYDLNWEMRGEYVVNALQDTAKSSQADIVRYLNDQNVDYQSFWIDNLIIVNSSSQNTFNGLMNFSEIESLKARRMMGVINPTVEDVPESVLAIEPNISHVLAPNVWELGISGTGIVVANIDTGVRSTHEALVRQYRGTTQGSHDFNWLGAAGGSGIPVDDHGHGTHTMGTMIGEDASQTNQIGVAPGAQWIACDGCEGASCPDAALLTCAQWIAAPYRIGDPGSLDASMRPHIVNNSWGDCGTSYDNWFQASVDAWHAAGIYPIFSNGNAGNCGYSSPPGLNTVGNPARYGNVTGVGSTGESNGLYATHSNWGPTDNLDIVNPKTGWEDLKPQVLAPGVSIRSSTPGNDSQYQDGWSGTSMSAPHVSGLVALIWQAAPCLIGNYAKTETIIEETATPILYDDGTGGISHSPNYATGWGEINALAAVQAAQNNCGGGALMGKVSNASTSNAIVGAQVIAVGITSTVGTTTDVLGYYTRTLAAGSYVVTAEAYGYQPSTVSNVEVFSGTTTTQDFALTPALMYTVDGTVSDANTGWPLYARLSIAGDPFDPPVTDLWTDPVTGYYQIDLAEGITYTFDVEAWVPGYLPASADVGPLSGDITADFSLDVNVASCTAPGYSPGVIGTFYDGFESGYGNWTLDGLWNAEAQGDTCGSLVAPFPSPTNAAYYGQDGICTYATAGPNSGALTMASAVLLPAASQLTYQSFEQTECGGNCNYDDRYVQISTDSGATWTNLGEASTEGSWYQNAFDLSAYGGMNAQIRFNFDSGDDFSNGYFGWMIDDVAIEELVCIPPLNGSLIVGNVYDENTQDALNGVVVENENGYMAEALATPLDDRVDDGFYSIYSPSGSKTFTATIGSPYGPDVDLVNVTTGNAIRHDFHLPSPSINVAPISMEVTVVEGHSKTIALEISNLGALASDFELTEIPGSPVVLARQPAIPSAGFERLKTVDVEEFIDTPLAPAADVIQDGGFEAGTPNPNWNESSTNFGTPICDVGSCGTGTGTGPRTGAFWVWFGGIAAYEEGQVDQDVIIPVGTATLNFWLEQIVCDSPSDYLEVLIDGTQVFLTDGGNPLCGVLGYSEQIVDISAYADGGVHDVVFHSETFASSGSVSNFFVDDVQLDAVPLMDIPWLSTDPITGTLPADSMQVIEVTFDTLTYTVGTYTGTLRVKSDDPVNKNIEVPVTMHVEAVSHDIEITAENDHLSGELGSVVTYTVKIKNSGNVTDSFDIAAGTHNWDVDMPTVVGPLEPAESHPFEIAITIPPDAGDGDSDSLIITASSQGNPVVKAEILLTTEAIIEKYLIYLPLVSK